MKPLSEKFRNNYNQYNHHISDFMNRPYSDLTLEYDCDPIWSNNPYPDVIYYNSTLYDYLTFSIRYLYTELQYDNIEFLIDEVKLYNKIIILTEQQRMYK